MSNPQGMDHPPMSYISLVEKIFNQVAPLELESMNAAMTLGAIINELAKITGITPAELILIGKSKLLTN